MDDDNRDTPGMSELNMEDYGHDDSDPSLTREEGAGASAGRKSGARQSNVGGSQAGHTNLGGYSSGNEGKHSGGHEGEMFGEFGNTDTGSDLTVDMMNTDAREELTNEEKSGE